MTKMMRANEASFSRLHGTEHSWSKSCDIDPRCLPVIEAKSKFITKDSGEREEYDSGMVRDTNKGKPRFDLLLTGDQEYEEQFLYRMAMLLTRGAEKYGDRNWENANSPEELDRFVESAFRHFIQWASAERDEDHAAAVVFNVMAAEYVRGKIID